MYSVAIAVAVGLLLGFGGWLLSVWGLGSAIFFTLLFGFAAWIVLVRRIGKRMQPMMLAVQRQLEAGHIEPAMQSLRDMLAWGKWMPMLEGQIQAQLGVITFQLGDTKEAEQLLLKSSRRVAEGQIFLATLQYRAGDKEKAMQTLHLASVVNRRHSLLHNVRAFLLHKEGQVDEAIKVLSAYLQKNKIDEIAKENLLRLQNGKKLAMKSLGMPWFMLGFEQPPPEMGQLRPHRKGFRTPPMRKNGS